jgi:hypothetical protein
MTSCSPTDHSRAGTLSSPYIYVCFYICFTISCPRRLPSTLSWDRGRTRRRVIRRVVARDSQSSTRAANFGAGYRNEHAHYIAATRRCTPQRLDPRVSTTRRPSIPIRCRIACFQRRGHRFNPLIQRASSMLDSKDSQATHTVQRHPRCLYR